MGAGDRLRRDRARPDLPGRHGDEVCAELVRAGCRSRVLMLTAAATIRTGWTVLGLGADDYLPSRSPSRARARLRALLRRAQPPHAPVLGTATCGSTGPAPAASRAGLALDLGPKGVRRAGAAARRAGAGGLRRGTAGKVWDEMADPVYERGQVTVSRLRRKLGDPPGHRDAGPGPATGSR